MLRVTKRWFVLVFVIVLVLLSFGTAQADEVCPNVWIRNESGLPIDAAAICRAAQPFVDKGLQVYIYATDADTPSEDAWFAILDRVESEWGIYDPQTGGFWKDAFAIEATTAASHPWGQNLTFGDSLIGTPLDNESETRALKGHLRTRIAEGDLTGAFVETLERSYALAFPPPAPTREPVPTTVPVAPLGPKPTVAPLGSQPTPEATTDSGPSAKVVGLIFLGVVIVAGVALLVFLVIIPLAKKLAYRKRLRAQIKLVRSRVSDLLVSLEGSESSPGLLRGDSPDETLVYALWSSIGGRKSVKQDAQVRECLRCSQKALGKAQEAWGVLVSAEEPKGQDELVQRTRDYEVIYLTLAGSDPDILGLTPDEQEALLDPMLVLPQGMLRGEVDSQLVSQIDQIVRRQRGAGSLKIELLVTDAAEFDEEGILGYMDQVKQLLYGLRQAREAAPKLLETVRASREKLKAEIAVPSGMTEVQVLACPDVLVKQAQLAIQEENWFGAQSALQQAERALEKIPGAAAALIKALEDADGKKGDVEAIRQEGFRLDIADAELIEFEEAAAVVRESIEFGAYPKALEHVREMEARSQKALELAQGLVALRAKNEGELRRLSTEVARVEGYRGQVQPDWDSLHEYPESNWSDLASFFTHATRTLADLFDDPTDDQDLASRIADANSMEDQLFEEAEAMLVESFSRLREAEEQLKALVARLAEVRKIEQSISTALETAQADLEKATARRDLDDVKIDAEVDRLIDEAGALLDRARASASGREYFPAQQDVNRVRKLASAAYASADEQAKAIDALYRRLDGTKASAKACVSKALTAQANLTPAAQKAGTAGLCHTAQDLLRSAVSAENTIAGSEDHKLAERLRVAIEAYDEAERKGLQALEQIAEDRREYSGCVSSAQSAIASAELAITTASGYVNDSDAEGHGRSALNRARQALPNSPSHGESKEALERKRFAAEQAKQTAQQAQAAAKRRIREVERAREAARAAAAAAAAAAARRARQQAANISRNTGYGSRGGGGSGFGSRGGRAGGMGSRRRH